MLSFPMIRIILSIFFVFIAASCTDEKAVLSFEEAKTSDGATLTASLKGRSISELINAWGEPMTEDRVFQVCSTLVIMI